MNYCKITYTLNFPSYTSCFLLCRIIVKSSFMLEYIYLLSTGAILNTTTTDWGSRQALLFFVWWKTSNIWPWGSSPSHRNRGAHICTQSTWNMSCLLLYNRNSWNIIFPFPIFYLHFVLSGWSLCIKWKEWPMAQQQQQASSCSSSRAQAMWTSALRFSSTSSSLVSRHLSV